MRGGNPQRRLLPVLFASCCVLLSLLRLGDVPAITFDEGYNLQVPMNLLRYGEYGTRNAGEAVLFDPHISTGPTVLAPIALTFVWFGNTLLAARLVIVTYFLATLLMLYWLLPAVLPLARRLIIVGVVALLLLPFARSVVGEVPALFWMLCGAVLWLRSSPPGNHRTADAALAGLCFGLAALTKLAALPLIAAALGLAWCLDRASGEKTHPPSHVGLAGVALLAPLAAWYCLQLWSFGWEDLVARVGAVSSHGPQVAQFSVDRVATNLGTLLGEGGWGWLMLAAPLTLLLVWRSGCFPQDRLSRLLLSFTAVTGVYYLFSFGWHRYSIWFGVFAVVLVLSVTQDHRSLSDIQPARRAWAAQIVAMAAAPVFTLLCAWTLLLSFVRPVTYLDPVLALINSHAAGASLWGSTEWEVDFMSGREFPHPPFMVVTEQSNVVDEVLSAQWAATEWVVLGASGRSFGAEDWVREHGYTTRLRSGPYAVYRRSAVD